MSIGLVLAGNEVSVVFADGAVGALSPEKRHALPEVAKHFDALKNLGVDLFPDRASLADRRITVTGAKLSAIARSRVHALLAEADKVIVW